MLMVSSYFRPRKGPGRVIESIPGLAKKISKLKDTFKSDKDDKSDDLSEDADSGDSPTDS